MPRGIILVLFPRQFEMASSMLEVSFGGGSSSPPAQEKAMGNHLADRDPGLCIPNERIHPVDNVKPVKTRRTAENVQSCTRYNGANAAEENRCWRIKRAIVGSNPVAINAALRAHRRQFAPVLFVVGEE